MGFFLKLYLDSQNLEYQVSVSAVRHLEDFTTASHSRLDLDSTVTSCYISSLRKQIWIIAPLRLFCIWGKLVPYVSCFLPIRHHIATLWIIYPQETSNIERYVLARINENTRRLKFNWKPRVYTFCCVFLPQIFYPWFSLELE